MQQLFVILLITELASLITCEESCDKLGILIYEDIGCLPVFQDGKACPVEYECENFKSNNNSCVFRGKKYNISEEVSENLTFEHCYAACRCEDPKSDEKFICAVLDCPEWLEEPDSNCYSAYDVDKCCSTGTLCPDNINLEECEFDGRQYREGELFFPENTCLKCACKKGFQGKLEAPFCKRNMCALQILNSDKLEKSCAPVYFHVTQESALCCPNDWICPSDAGSENLLKIESNIASNTDLKCKFGSNLYMLGEGFRKSLDFYGRERNVSCECILPPLLTCKEKLINV